MKKQISIGIAAYNEESNIGKLIKKLLDQVSNTYNLLEIILVVDGSTDNTLQIVENINNKKIKIINIKKRSGLANAQNEILKRYKGDILIILNADVLPENSKFIDNLIKPFIDNSNIGLTGPQLTPVKANTFFEKVINFSVEFKNSLGESWRDGDNLYLCRGAGRAFSRKLADKIKWTDSLSEDAYSYLLCKRLGFGFRYVPTAKLIFKSPDNFHDHMKQSARFISGPRIMLRYFSEQYVLSEYKPPKVILMKNTILYFFKNPILMICYIFIVIFIGLYPQKSKYSKSKWDVSKSSKTINLSNE